MSSSRIPNLSPPPLPPRPPDLGRNQRGAKGPPITKRKKLLILLGGILGVGLLVVGAIAFYAFLFFLTADDIELNEGEMACIVTIDDLANLRELEIHRKGESWDNQRFVDRSVQIYYFYDDWLDEEVQISCNLTIERKVSDALIAYNIEWGGLNVTNRWLGENSVKLEMANEVFAWGDQSKFAFQTIEGERYGFAFVGRKGRKVFFLDCWGILLEDPEEIRDLLNRHLTQFEKESFKKR